MTHLAVTVVSHDRPGLIADVTEVLAELGGNLASSSMSLLQGHFAWTLVVDVDSDVETVRDRLLPVCPRGVTVLELDSEAEDPGAHGERVIVTLHGGDRIGIVAAVSRQIAEAGGNIVELTTHLHHGMYLGTAEVEFDRPVDIDELDARLREAGDEIGVTVTAHREDTDVL